MVTTYSVLKTIHVLAMAIWFGGGSIEVVAAVRARRTRDPEKLADVVRQIAWVGPRTWTWSCCRCW